MKCDRAAIPSVLVGSLVLTASAWAAPTVYPYGVTIHEAGVAEGYVIFGGQDDLVHLIDVNGTDVHTWTLPCGSSYVQRPLADGRVLSESCGNLVELDWEGTVVWEFTPPAGVIIHHDWERLANGNTLILCQQTINEPSISDTDIQDDFILEVSPGGTVVWEWHLADHFDELGFSQNRIDMIDARGGDWSHATAISRIPDSTAHSDPRFSPGNIILSLRYQNTIAIIERGTGQIVWVDTDRLIGPHSAYMIPSDLPGGDNIMAFDNGFAGDWLPLGPSSAEFNNRDDSRVLEIDPVDGSLDWTYQDTLAGFLDGTFFSDADGGAQRLSNGSTLITEGKSGRIFEVTNGLVTVWEYVSPYFNASNSNAIYRAYKVPLDWAGPRLAPGPGAAARGRGDGR
jgi:hypothetical protein